MPLPSTLADVHNAGLAGRTAHGVIGSTQKGRARALPCSAPSCSSRSSCCSRCVSAALRLLRLHVAQLRGLVDDGENGRIVRLSVRGLQRPEIEPSASGGDVLRRQMLSLASRKQTTRTDKNGAITTRTEIKLWDKVGALEKIARHLGMFAGRDDASADGLTIRVVRE